jgi:hypothetical protein
LSAHVRRNSHSVVAAIFDLQYVLQLSEAIC